MKTRVLFLFLVCVTQASASSRTDTIVHVSPTILSHEDQRPTFPAFKDYLTFQSGYRQTSKESTLTQGRFSDIDYSDRALPYLEVSLSHPLSTNWLINYSLGFEKRTASTPLSLPSTQVTTIKSSQFSLPLLVGIEWEPDLASTNSRMAIRSFLGVRLGALVLSRPESAASASDWSTALTGDIHLGLRIALDSHHDWGVKTSAGVMATRIKSPLPSQATHSVGTLYLVGVERALY